MRSLSAWTATASTVSGGIRMERAGSICAPEGFGAAQELKSTSTDTLTNGVRHQFRCGIFSAHRALLLAKLESDTIGQKSLLEKIARAAVRMTAANKAELHTGAQLSIGMRRARFRVMLPTSYTLGSA